MTGIQFINFYIVVIDKLDTRLKPGFTEIIYIYIYTFFSCWTPVYTENQTKRQNELPIARKVVSPI